MPTEQWKSSDKTENQLRIIRFKAVIWPPYSVLKLFLVILTATAEFTVFTGVKFSFDENGVYFDAVRRLKAIGVHVITHIIIGLPGDSVQDAVETTRQAIAAGTDGIKFHLLHVLQNTALADEYAAGRFHCLTLEEYAQTLKQCLSQVPESVVVHRMTGDGAKRDLIAPLWSGDKKYVLNYLNHYLK